MTLGLDALGPARSSADLAAAIAAERFSGCAATVVGYGSMGRQYVGALRALGVERIRVCSRSAQSLDELRDVPGIELVAGGLERLQCAPLGDELGIVSTPTGMLMAAADRLASLGFRRLLVEKPVSLQSVEIERFADKLERQGLDAVCGYNRVAYPSLYEVAARTAQEGGITSCTYTFTEMIKPDWPQRFSIEELARWGIANSLHVVSMAHGLIGLPNQWSGYRLGALAWHPTGSVFVGSGISTRNIPFAYHADWGSTGRWSVEVHTRASSYRLCPLEQVLRRTSALGEWEAVPVVTFAPAVKAGFVEQVAAMMSPEIRRQVPLLSLSQAAALTRYGEEVFGYGPGRD